MPEITQDLACDICGYNLKGIDDAGNCPECGQPVERTINAALHFSDAGWLRYQARTMLLLVALCLINFRQDPFFAGVLWYFITSFIFQGAAACVTVWACWRLATPEPPLPPSESQSAVKRALRFLPSVLAAYILLAIFRRSLPNDLMNILSFAAIASLVITLWLVVFEIGKIARRARQPSLTRHARLLLWAFPGAQGAYFAAALILNLMRSEFELFGVFFVVFNWAIAVTTFLFALLLGRMHELLHRATGEAENPHDPAPAE